MSDQPTNPEQPSTPPVGEQQPVAPAPTSPAAPAPADPAAASTTPADPTPPAEPTAPVPASPAAPADPAAASVPQPDPAGSAAPATPASTPPAAFPAPATPGWGTTASPAASAKRNPKTIIGAAVAGVAVLGGIFAAGNLFGGDEKPSASADEIPGAIVVSDAPTPAPPVTIPAPGPSVPEPVVTTTIPENPPPTISPEPVDEGGSTTGDLQMVTQGGIGVAVPSGWSVEYSEANESTGYAEIVTEGALFTVQAQPWDGDAGSLAEAWVELQSQSVDSIEFEGGESAVPSANVVSAFGGQYSGLLAGQQGSVPVEAVVLTFITQDGIGVILETFNAIGDWDQHVDAYVEMRDSVIATL